MGSASWGPWNEGDVGAASRGSKGLCKAFGFCSRCAMSSWPRLVRYKCLDFTFHLFPGQRAGIGSSLSPASRGFPGLILSWDELAGHFSSQV